MKTLLLLVSLLALALVPAIARADGMFVPRKFVWDKHKDINEPTQKAIIVYDAGREDLVLQVKYEGPVEQFGWLVPVPTVPTVQNGSMKCFYELSKLTQQREMGGPLAKGRGTYAAIGDESTQAEPEVKVIEVKTVGAYKIAILSANDSGALKKWLDDNQFVLPPDPSGVIDSYIQRHWDFVAVKIDLDKSMFNLSATSTSSDLASGELNPLQISFASDHCVFPLRISSLNGKPSEVQLYVLASDPLLCQAQYERDNVITYSNDMANVDRFNQRMQQMQKERDERFKARGLPLPVMLNDVMPRIKKPEATPDELIQFTKADDKDLPDCEESIPRLGGKSWWIAKKTWTFNPPDMRDLDFGLAIPVLAEMLGSKYGYIAAANLGVIGADAVPLLITMLNNSSSVARDNAAGTLVQFSNDPRVKAAAPAWLKNSDPQTRVTAIYALAGDPNQKPGYIDPIIPLLTDEDASVREAALAVVMEDKADLPKYQPVFQKMLMDTNPAVQAYGLQLAWTAGVNFDRSEWLSFFKIPDKRALGIAATHFRGTNMQYDLSDDEAVALLQNSEPLGRLIGLAVLRQHGDAHAIELARPLLNDPNPAVSRYAQRALQHMTGQ